MLFFLASQELAQKSASRANILCLSLRGMHITTEAAGPGMDIIPGMDLIAEDGPLATGIVAQEIAI